MFSSKSFIVSGLTFRSLIHFEFIFVYGIRKCSSFILLQVVDQFSQHHLLKRLSFFHCIRTSYFLVPKSCPALCNPMDSSIPGSSVLCYLPEFGQIHVHLVNDAILPSHPLPPLSLIAFKLSQHQGIFQWVSSWHRWPKYWSFSFSHSPFNENSGLTSFKIDWFNLLAVKRILKCLLQHQKDQKYQSASLIIITTKSKYENPS